MHEDELTFSCSCGCLSHVVQFSRWDDEAFLSVTLEEGIPFWQRLKAAFRYAFRNRVCGYSQSCVILRREDLPRIREWLAKAEKAFANGGGESA